jgi:methylglutaconyl-CoA hydratase
MAMVWNSVRRGPRAVARPFAILSQAKQLADRSGTNSVPQSDSGKAPAIVSFSPIEVKSSWSGSCGPYSSRRRSLFIDAISEQVALQNLSGSEEGIAVLTLNRPEAKNAIGVEMLSKLRASLENLQFHTSARILIICSTVPGVFCAGADLKERRKMGVAEAQKFVHTLRSTFNALETLPIPTIAAVEGAALGGGDEAVFGLPETGLAIIPGAGGTQRLPRILGRARAKELIYTGRRITGEQVETIGLVNHCVLAGNAYQKAVEIAQEITKQVHVFADMTRCMTGNLIMSRTSLHCRSHCTI